MAGAKEGAQTRLLRNELVIRKHGRCSELWSIAFVFLTTQSSVVKKGEHPKAVQAGASAAANRCLPKTFIMRFKL